MEKAITTLANGVEIPLLGYGVYQIPPQETARCVADAINVGYSHIDTAQAYNNEKEVGKGIHESGAKREDLFVTTKLWVTNYREEDAAASIDGSLRRLGTDYIDLMLLHQDFGDVYGGWRALEKAYKAGKIRAIGVSNFSPARLNDLGTFNEIYPMVDQIETNPMFQQKRANEFLTSKNVVQEAWAPFGEGKNNMFTNPVLTKIGDVHGKTAAQVILRWLMQRGIVTLAKSTHKDRMEQNFDVFDFELTPAEMNEISGLDTEKSLFIDFEDPNSPVMFSQFPAPRE